MFVLTSTHLTVFVRLFTLCFCRTSWDACLVGGTTLKSSSIRTYSGGSWAHYRSYCLLSIILTFWFFLFPDHATICAAPLSSRSSRHPCWVNGQWCLRKPSRWHLCKNSNIHLSHQQRGEPSRYITSTRSVSLSYKDSRVGTRSDGQSLSALRFQRTFSPSLYVLRDPKPMHD